MDRLDTLSAWALALLLVAALAILFTQEGEAGSKPQIQATQVPAGYVRPELSQKISVAKGLLAGNNLEKAEELLQGMATDFPYEGDVFMLLGEFHMRRQNPMDAMLAFRNAVDLNPDYLDKKAPAFQGKKIKVAVEEAFGVIQKGLEQDPDNASLKDTRKTLYYMKRRIAGSCG